MQTLNTLLNQAESQRDTAQAALRDALAAADRHHEQARQLHDYRCEYQARWAEQFSRQAAIEIVHCYRSFMERLEQAESQQERTCAFGDVQVEQARARLTQCELQVASVRKLIERRVKELQQHQQRLDQKRDDEAGQRAAWRRSNATDPHFH